MPASNQSPARKYSVHFITEFNTLSCIHIFAESAEAAEAEVRKSGVGFSDGRTVFPKRITKVECLESPAPEHPAVRAAREICDRWAIAGSEQIAVVISRAYADEMSAYQSLRTEPATISGPVKPHHGMTWEASMLARRDARVLKLLELAITYMEDGALTTARDRVAAAIAELKGEGQ